ncbi:uncharacterized protein LOC110846251 [Folsomia candida]|uniref:uncharacterized protein LOC110846251 n=1 Tax=Folsomia candida TaxID=158441 RepID=UPI000B8F5241|nr:uncharacterized protein LOC110846251 [Folsomia candida]
MKCSTLLALCCSLFTVLQLSPTSVSANAILPIFVQPEYDEFFRFLSNEEKEWMMNLAVWYFDTDNSQVSPFPIETGEKQAQQRFGLKPNPIPLNYTASDIPDRLISQFLNGDVPKLWQKEFTKWLTKTYKLKPKNFMQYRATGVFCVKGDDCDLIDLSNVGGICCPFG